jgi:hypothetical protein
VDPAVDIAAIHGYVIGYGIMGSWLLIMLLSLVLRLVKRGDADVADVGWYWRTVSFAQILLVVQLLIGTYLFIRGGRPGPDTFTHVFHPLYGFVFPAVVLFYAHKVAREGRANPFSAFAVAGLVIFALTLRGFQAIVFPA